MVGAASVAALPASRARRAPRDVATPLFAALALVALALAPWAMDGGGSALALAAGASA
jgi:hypothetical protein